MALTEERKAGLLAYCKLTELAGDPEVQSLIPVFYEPAVVYMAEAGVSEPEEGTGRRALFDLCTYYLTLDAWEHRDIQGYKATFQSPSYIRIKNQLKLTEPGGTYF